MNAQEEFMSVKNLAYALIQQGHIDVNAKKDTQETDLTVKVNLNI